VSGERTDKEVPVSQDDTSNLKHLQLERSNRKSSKMNSSNRISSNRINSTRISSNGNRSNKIRCNRMSSNRISSNTVVWGLLESLIYLIWHLMFHINPFHVS
ncbi:hypothetical protein PoB_006902600, partial [Plakobranchus ocellatus]